MQKRTLSRWYPGKVATLPKPPGRRFFGIKPLDMEQLQRDAERRLRAPHIWRRGQNVLVPSKVATKVPKKILKIGKLVIFQIELSRQPGISPPVAKRVLPYAEGVALPHPLWEIAVASPKHFRPFPEMAIWNDAVVLAVGKDEKECYVVRSYYTPDERSLRVHVAHVWWDTIFGGNPEKGLPDFEDEEVGKAVAKALRLLQETQTARAV